MTREFDGPLLAGRWRLGPRLGGGGQGRTFLARDESVRAGERIAVVKELKLAGQSWKRFELFERELRVLQKLNHAGIPKLLDSFEEPVGVHHIVMARAPGATLRAIARRARFTDEEIADILRRVLEILNVLHERDPPIIHRDIKPANLLRDTDGTISLVDFGAVLETARDDGGSTVVGTFGYMAPEQLHGAATPRTDLYGLAATAVALAGRVEPEDIPRRGLRMDLERHLPKMASELRALLTRMTDPDPDGRPASAAEALAVLDAAKRRRGTSRPAVPAKPAARPTPEAIEDDLIVDDGSIPRPIFVLLLLALFVLGAVGSGLLFVADVVAVPFAFAIARAFSLAPNRAPRRRWLRETETRARASLRDTRQGFRALMRRSTAHSSRQAALPRKKPRG